jgi:hypothetical protein
MAEKNEKIQEYIKKEILQSGFPLEIKIATILDKNGWKIIPHLIYPNDSKTGQYQEIDVHATKPMRNYVDNIQNVLVIECKKQESKPWVFFEQDLPNKEVFTINVSPEDVNYLWIENNFFHQHHYFNNNPCSYHLPCFIKRHNKGGEKKDNADEREEAEKSSGDVTLKAINQVLDGLIFSMKMEIERFQQLAQKRISFLYPVIVFDGRLFSAKLLPNGEIETKERESLQLKVSRALKETLILPYSKDREAVMSVKSYIIDIVHKDHFEEYIKKF